MALGRKTIIPKACPPPTDDKSSTRSCAEEAFESKKVWNEVEMENAETASLDGGLSNERSSGAVAEKTTALPSPECDTESPLRVGDTGLGRRKVVAKPCEPPSQTPEEQGEEEVDTVPAPSCEITFFDRIQRFTSPILILITAVLGYYIFGNLASFYQDFCEFSKVEKICFGIPMGIFVGLLFYMLWKLVCVWFRLRIFTQISAKALRELEERGELRRLSRQCNQAARGELEKLLRGNTSMQDKFIIQVAPQIGNSLKVERERLLKEHCLSKDWIDLFVKNYQSKLDEVANKRISHYSWQAAIVATISPFPALDQLIVLKYCVTLLKELFQIYNLKPKWDKNLLLMARIVIHVYVTGFWQQLAGTEVVAKGLGILGRNVASGIGRILAEGAMHKITVSRLGTAAIRVLQPVGE